MKKLIFVFAFAIGALAAQAQEKKLPVYGELGLGFGQTLFMGDTQSQLREALGGTFDPGIVSNIIMAVYYAPVRWKGVGIGSRIKGSVAGSVTGDFGDSYFFNYYNLSASVKYYAFSRKFNTGWYARAGIGTGQLTTKRANEDTNSYVHQFAVGATFTGGIGYTLPFQHTAISLEAEFEHSSRSGTIHGVGDQSIISGQLGINFIYSF